MSELEKVLKNLVETLLQYDATVTNASKIIWKAIDIICSELEKEVRNRAENIDYSKSFEVNGVAFSIDVTPYRVGCHLRYDFNSDEIKMRSANIVKTLPEVIGENFVLAKILFAFYIDEFIKKIDEEVERLRKDHEELAKLLERIVRPFKGIITVHQLTK